MDKSKLFEALLADYPKASQVAAFFRQLQGSVQEARKALHDDIKARLAEIRQPADGKDGKNGKDGARGPKGDKGDKGDSIVGPQGPAGRDGRDGRDGKDVDPDTVQSIDEKLEDFEQRLNAQKPGNGIFIGPSRGIFLYIDGVKKGLINNANLKAGTGVSLAYSKVNGQDTITINATGGGSGGVTVETPPETPDASRTQFTASAEPQWVVADGTTYYEGAGYTYADPFVNMTVPPSATIRLHI